MLDFMAYRDKVRACWLGKNIGGTLGAPLECWRGAFDLDYYTHDLSQGVLPNDDLDLQLAWLCAAEKYGKGVNAKILGEYWLSFVVADWSEYGAGKNNLRYGLQPPLSGWYGNHNKDSCGCFIRSEIWACLMPGHPELAVKYAYEDAICDHADEGVYGEMFCAALQSAAFVESNMDELLRIAKCYVPADCAVVKAVDTAVECYRKGLNWKQARKAVMCATPGSMGQYNGYKNGESEEDIPLGKLGFDVPSNIGLMMIGWLYGEGDFSKSICIAAGCGEDADCTAGTLGATLGILLGTKAIDEKWLLPIGDEIKSISLDMSNFDFRPPNTVSDLTNRVIALMPTFMHGFCTPDETGKLVFAPVKTVSEGKLRRGTMTYTTLREELCGSPVCLQDKSVLFDVRLTYGDDSVQITEGKPKTFTLRFINNFRIHQWLELELVMPDAWLGRRGHSVFLDNQHGGCGIREYTFEITPEALDRGRYDLLLQIRSRGRANVVCLPIPLLVD